MILDKNKEKLLLSNTIRILSIDAIEKSQSGHPGMPMGMSDIATVLWRTFLSHCPSHPKWINRDRFILSNGHGSILQYVLLYLSGYDLSLEDIKNFRQLNSKTPGHPEFNHTVGIETTTGPLGQGIANAVGFALSEKILSAKFNKKDICIIDHYTYVFAGDGCLMEGISHEACSLAGTWKLNKLILVWDNNNISIDGKTDKWFTEDIEKRFQSYGWNVIKSVNGHDFISIEKAFALAKQEKHRPTIICMNTIIGNGSINFSNTEKIHGTPLTKKEISLIKKNMGFPDKPFYIPNILLKKWSFIEKGKKLFSDWNKIKKKYQYKYYNDYKELRRRLEKKLPDIWFQESLKYIKNIKDFEIKNMATRKYSLEILEKFSLFLPELLGGSADLSNSNCVKWKNSISYDVKKDIKKVNYIHYGVREFAMSSIMNGISVYGGFIVFGGTFLVFVDYLKPALRLSALMKQKIIYILTHDSVAVGEDGPTHQPIEQLSSIRLIPNVICWRPYDYLECGVVWKKAIEENKSPVCIILSRQNIISKRKEYDIEVINNIAKGAYIIEDCKKNIDMIIIASGTEVSIPLSIRKYINCKNIRIISMVSQEIFDQQNKEYKEHVIPKNTKYKVSIELGSTGLWYKYIGLHGLAIGLDTFGISAPYKKIFECLSFTENNILKRINNFIKERNTNQ